MGLGLALIACAPESSGGGPSRARTAATPFELALSAERGGASEARARAGEAIELVLRVTNTSAAPQHITLPSACAADFAVSDTAGRERWRASRGRMCAAMITELVFEPGETKLFRERWMGTGSAGEALAAGTYRARGWLGAGEAGESPAFELQVE